MNRTMVVLVTVLLIASSIVMSGCGTMAATTVDAATDTIADEDLEQPTEYIDATSEAAPNGTVVEVTETEAPAVETPLSTLASLDETWKLYTNHKLGFSVQVPYSMTLFFGDCTFNEAQNSYRPQYTLVPTAIFENEDTAYLTFAYYAELRGKTMTPIANGGARADFSECVTVGNTLALVLDPDHLYKQLWAIQVTEAADDAALERFIQERYGSGCKVGDMVATAQEGVFDVHIQSDGKHFTESTCPINYGTVVKYDTNRHKVAAWNLGQAYTFSANPENTITYDADMVESFRFID